MSKSRHARPSIPPISRVGTKRFEAFDGLRAIAVVMVFAYHLAGRYLPGGWIGVDLFFALSGYLITSLLLKERANNGYIDLRVFYVRRVLRLVPALVVMITVVTPLAILAGIKNSLMLGLVALLYAMDIYAPLLGEGGIFAHTWSLAVEEQFYLLWPLLLTLVARRSWPLIPIAIGLASAGFVAGAFVAQENSPLAAYHSPFPHLPVILGGVVLAIGMQRAAPWLARLDTCWIPVLACVATLLFVPFVEKENLWLFYGGKAVLGLLFVLLIGHLCVRTTGRLARALACRPLSWLGKRSYGFYLWHFCVTWTAHALPVSKPVAALFAITVSLALTVLSWELVERPFLRIKDRLNRT